MRRNEHRLEAIGVGLGMEIHIFKGQSEKFFGEFNQCWHNRTSS